MRSFRTAALAALLLAGTAVPAARAQEPLPTVVQDDAQLLHRSEAETRASLARLQALGVSTIRTTAGWSVLTRDADATAPPEGFDQTDPAAYEQGRFRGLDRLVRLAPQYGLDVLLDVGFWAPHWAAQEPDPSTPRARTRVDPEAYGRFATAIARRYAGAFTPPEDHATPAPSRDEGYLDALFGLPGAREDAATSAMEPAPDPLPRVRLFSLWNEPNHPAFLLPQLTGEGAKRRVASADVYRAMVLAAYPAMKAVQADATVLVGGTAAQGTRDRGVSPLAFVRRLACVDKALRPIVDGACAHFTPVPGDGFTHHPYSLRTVPSAHARNPDDVPIGDLPKLTGLLGSLVAAGRLAPGMADVWITEYGYEANPQDPNVSTTEEEQARYLAWAEYLAWRTPHVRSYAQFLLDDLPASDSVETTSARRPHGEWSSGLARADGQPKLAYDAFTAGLYLGPGSGRGRALAWIRLRALGAGEHPLARLEVQSPGAAGFHPLRSTAGPGQPASIDFAAGSVAEREVRIVRGGRYRVHVRSADGMSRVTAAVPFAR